MNGSGRMRYDGTGAQKVLGWTAFYRMRFHRVVGGGRSTARACGRQHECLMERVGSLGSTRESSLSLSLSSFSSSDITRDNVTRRSNKGTRRRGGRARGMDKVTDRLRWSGAHRAVIRFHGGQLSYRGSSLLLSRSLKSMRI